MEHFQTQLYVALTKGTSVIFTQQLTFHGLRKVHTVLASIF